MYLLALAALAAIALALRAFATGTGDAFTQFELLLREEINDAVHDLTLPNEDVSWSLLNTFQPVDVAGRTTSRAGGTEGAAGYEASWRVLIQRGGAIGGAVFSGNTFETAGPGSKLMMGQTLTAPYLNPAKTPSRSYLDIAMRLCRVVGQLVINRQQIFADLATKPLAQVAAESTEDAVHQVRSMFEALFWSQGYGVVATLDEAAGATILDSAVSYVHVADGTIHRFVIGQRYFGVGLTAGVPMGNAIRQGAVNTANTPGYFRCVDIDVDDGTVGFEAEAAEDSIALTDGDGICMFNMTTFADEVNAGTNLAMQSIETLLRGSGTYPGTNYDVATYRMLKSFVTGDETAPVEPEIERLIEIIDKMADAGLPVPPMVVAESSVWSRMALLEKQAYGTVTIPQGTAFNPAPGVAMPAISHNNYRFQPVVSSKCRPGAWHGFDPATFKRFMPLGNTIRWLMNQGGVSNQSGIFRLITSSGVASELSAADFDFFVQLGQDNPRSAFRRIGLISQKTAIAAA
jgi:hypothetical protein